MALRVIASTGAEVGRSTEGGLVRSAERAVRIVETIAAEGPLTLTELQRVLGVPRPRLRAMVRTLCELQWIELSPGGGYGVGPRALLAGVSYLDQNPVLPPVHETLDALRQELGYTVHFGRLDGGHVLYLASSEAAASGQAASLAGRRLPAARTAIGQALLAELTVDEIGRQVPGLDPALHEELARVRARSWAFERDQAIPGVACVATVVPHVVPATGALCCCLPGSEASDDTVTGVVEAIVRHGRKLAAALRREAR
jgi:DNA-binding IclR family transcriptional regulator